MNTQKLLDAAGATGPDYDWLREIAERVAARLGNWLSLDESRALIDLLQSHSFRYEDGFIINDERDLNRSIWLADAAAVAAAFSPDLDRDWLWFKTDFGSFDDSNPDFIQARQALLERILGDPQVHLLEDPTSAAQRTNFDQY